MPVTRAPSSPPRGAPRLEGDDPRVRSGGEPVVEVAQHRRMGGGRDQQGLEAAGDVRPDRVALERADQAASRALEDRDGEVVGPEPLQPLGERPLGCRGGGEARPGIGDQRCRDSGRRTPARPVMPGGGFFAWTRLFALFGDKAERGRRVEQAAAARRIGRADLRREPAFGVAADDAEIRLAQSEPMRCNRGLQLGDTAIFDSSKRCAIVRRATSSAVFASSRNVRQRLRRSPPLPLGGRGAKRGGSSPVRLAQARSTCRARARAAVDRQDVGRRQLARGLAQAQAVASEHVVARPGQVALRLVQLALRR